ncbi:MAG: helicase associated domain-containing protein [Bacteroidales bacterium]|nr:helicase associated domain-containing protein [Bacteroidales bacterium]
MGQETHWLTRYNEVKEFIEREQRNPSKHRIEDHNMLNWLKASRKKMNAGELKEERIAKFKELLVLVEENKRKNQYA